MNISKQKNLLLHFLYCGKEKCRRCKGFAYNKNFKSIWADRYEIIWPGHIWNDKLWPRKQENINFL